jgi:hypothetical protein
VLGIGVTLAVLQQWCGINVIFNYAQEIFSAAGYTLSNIFFNIVITGVVMCVFTFVAIATVERLGSRRLMLVGCAGLAILYVILECSTSSTSTVFRCLARGGGYCLLRHDAGADHMGDSLGDIPERSPWRVHGHLHDSLWAACFMLTYTFPLLNSSLGTARTFWIYAGVCAQGLCSCCATCQRLSKRRSKRFSDPGRFEQST